MSGRDALLDAPAAARYHRQAIEEISNSVEERVFCALLGPRLSGKTLILRYIEGSLAKLLGWKCVYIDLLQVRTTTQQAFFSDLIHTTSQRFSEVLGIDLSPADEPIATSATFRAFLSDCLERSGSDLVLLIDPLEALPTDLVQALLTSLRAAYMEQQNQEHQVTVVVSGALSLATLTVGESSPFRGIARRIFVSHLSVVESRTLIQEFLSQHNISTTRQAVDKLLFATSGDIYLIHRIGQRCVDLVRSRSESKLHARDVNSIVERFLREEVFHYAPLNEAVRLIEENPDLLNCILLLLKQESVSRADIPLALSPDLDPLYLTGVVEKAQSDQYRLANLTYHRFLEGHFSPARVGHVLAMAGRWDSAIDYLEASILHDRRQPHTDLLPATLNSMYAAQDLSQAAHFLRRGLVAAFGLQEIQIWFNPPQEKYLQLIGPLEINPAGEPWVDFQISLTADRLEARAYRQQVPLRGLVGEKELVRAIPLVIPGSQPIGVATIFGDLPDISVTSQRERDLQLVGFLNQAARALHTVSLRRYELMLAGRVQASLLPKSPPELPGWQIATAWKPARETSGDFYDFIPLSGGRLGLVIGDVVDKGMGAALLMTLSRTLIRTYAGEYSDQPEQLLAEVNRRIIEDMNAGLFVTLFYAILDPQTGRIVYSNAGHPPPRLLLSSEGGTSLTLEKNGMPLGISEDASWTQASSQIPPGGLLVLYTDGVLDAQNSSGDFFGQDQFMHATRGHFDHSAQDTQDGLITTVFTFAGSEPQLDDITLMVLKRDKGE
jgi:hypothetical protein